MEDIIINIITVGIPSATSVIVGFFNYKVASRNSAKHSILQLIMEDRMDWKDGKFPSNYQAVLHEYDVYKKNGGNSYVEQRVEEYKAWYAKVEGEWKNGRTSVDTKEDTK